MTNKINNSTCIMNSTDSPIMTTRAFLKRMSLLTAGSCALHQVGLGWAARPDPAGPFVEVSVQAYTEAIKIMAEFARKQIENLPDAENNPRESGFGVMAMIGLGGAVGWLSLPFAGAALGGGIGLALDVCVAGTDVGAGTVAGLMIGSGGAVLAGNGILIGSLLACIPVLAYVEEKYPYSKYHRGQASTRGAVSTMAVANFPVGGPAPSQEAVFVNLVTALPDSLLALVEHWDRTPRLNDAARRWLQTVSFLRADLEKLAWIKRNRRASSEAPVVPNLLADVSRMLQAVDDAMEEAWFAALGLGSVEVALSGGRLRVETPPSLRHLGLPVEVSSLVHDFQMRTGGAGGLLDPWVRVRFQPGPFEILWGRVSLVASGKDKGLVRVGYDIKPNSRVGKAEFQYKWNGPVKEILEFEPTMGRGFKGSLYFSLDGLGLKFVRAEVDSFDLKTRLPRELESAADQLKHAVEDLTREFTQAVERAFGPALPWASVLDHHVQAAIQGLEHRLKRDAVAHGMARIERVEKVTTSTGKMAVQVRGQALPRSRPVLPEGELQELWHAFAQSRRLRLTPAPVQKPRHSFSALNQATPGSGPHSFNNNNQTLKPSLP